GWCRDRFSSAAGAPASRPAPAPRPRPSSGAGAPAAPCAPARRPMRSSRECAGPWGAHPALPAERRGEMADVVDAAHDQPLRPVLDRGYGGVTDAEGEQPRAVAADGVPERDLDHAAVRHDQDVALRMLVQEPLDDAVHA